MIIMFLSVHCFKNTEIKDLNSRVPSETTPTQAERLAEPQLLNLREPCFDLQLLNYS